MTAYDRLPSPTLNFAFDVTVDLGPVEDHGRTSAGHRRVVPILGGRITGALEAEVLPGGADWQVVRPDGTIEIDGRYTACTPSGELLLLHTTGLRTGATEVLADLGRGIDVDPRLYYFRTTVTVETAELAFASLQRALFIAVAQREASSVRYRAYRVG